MTHTNEHGYVRYFFSTAGKCGHYEHILVARIAWGPRVPWPVGVEVHHLDGARTHNCRANLLILGGALHHAFTCEHARRFSRGRQRKARQV